MGKGSGTRVELVPCNKLKRRKFRIITSITNAKGGCLQYNISDALLLFFIKASTSTYYISTTFISCSCFGYTEKHVYE